MSNVFSFEELVEANGTKYDTVECHGGTLRLGTLSSADMISWIKTNNSDGPEAQFAGLLLLVMCIVDANGKRIPEERRQEFVQYFMNKDSADNRAAIRKAREINGLEDLVKLAAALGNASGEVKADASPSDSPATSDE